MKTGADLEGHRGTRPLYSAEKFALITCKVAKIQRRVGPSPLYSGGAPPLFQNPVSASGQRSQSQG